jgi:hypothetical protein
MTSTEGADFIVKASKGVLLPDIAKIVVAFVPRGWYCETVREVSKEDPGFNGNTKFDYRDEENTRFRKTLDIGDGAKQPKAEFETVSCALRDTSLVISQILNKMNTEMVIALPVACDHCMLMVRMLGPFSRQTSSIKYVVAVASECSNNKNYAIVADFEANRSAAVLLHNSYTTNGGYYCNESMTHMILKCEDAVDEAWHYIIDLANLTLINYAQEPARKKVEMFLAPHGELLMLQQSYHTQILLCIRREGRWRMLELIRIPPRMGFGAGYTDMNNGRIVVYDKYDTPKWTIVLFETYGSKDTVSLAY